MLNQIINIMFMTLAGTAQGIALEYMLEVNNLKTNKLFRIVYWTILALMPSILNIMIDSGNSTIVLRNSIHWGMAIIAIFWFYLGPVWRRVIAVILVYFGMTTADLVLLIVIQVTEIDWNVFWNKGSTISVVFVGIGMSISVVTIAFIAFVWRKVFYKGENVKYFGFFMIYMLGYTISIAYSQLQIWSNNLSSASLWPILTSMICEIALLAIIFNQSEKDAIEKKLSEVKLKNELEQIYYEEITRRREEIESISIKNKLQIEKILIQLKAGCSIELEKELKQFLQQLEMTREYAYCEIPVINALLTEKKNECEKAGIQLQVNMKLQKEINIQQMDLCSIIGNLMDNAIRACVRISNDEIERRITLTAGVNKNYLIVKCENNTAKAPGAFPEGTGYGLKIMKDIAERYHGYLQTCYENGTFTARISLRL